MVNQQSNLDNQMITFLMSLLRMQQGQLSPSPVQMPVFNSFGFGGSSFIQLDSPATRADAEQILQNATYRNSVAPSQLTDLVLKSAQSYSASAGIEARIEEKVNQVIANRMVTESSLESRNRSGISGQEAHDLYNNALKAVSSSNQLVSEVQQLQQEMINHGQYVQKVNGYVNYILRTSISFYFLFFLIVSASFIENLKKLLF